MSNLFETERYIVRKRDNSESIVGEDGKYTMSHDGYVVVNKETNVIEHSTTMLPGAIFQCQHFNDTLVSLLTDPEDNITALTSVDVPDDVVPN